MYYYEITSTWTARRYPLVIQPAGYYSSKMHIGASIVPAEASRIWFESDEKVIYIKDSTSWDRAVDMKEFAWIKLKAQPLKGRV